ncbi:hypothetical protein AB0878_10475 [Amycolatopsis sp. NPDC047767]
MDVVGFGSAGPRRSAGGALRVAVEDQPAAIEEVRIALGSASGAVSSGG